MLYTNIKLYGYLYEELELKEYKKLDNERVIVDTWKFIIYNKNKETIENKKYISKIPRYENMIWRKWYMNENKCNKINFATGTDLKNNLYGPVILIKK